MAEIKGTNVAAPIVPFTDSDIYATHEAKYGKGGYRSVNDLEELRNIPPARLEEGMIVYVLNDPDGIHIYQYLNNHWGKSKINAGIPIYNQELIDDLGINPNKESYISIPNFSDLTGEVKTKNYETSINGNYVDILFRALRELQSEVAKLKNSFKYGIESYTGTATTLSVGVNELTAPEDEPLWAVMESSLSRIVDVSLEEGHPFVGDNIQIIRDLETTNTYLKFIGSGYWKPTEEVLIDTDSKIFLYITSQGKDIKYTLDVFDDFQNIPIDSEKYERVVDLSKINFPVLSESGMYNILLVISRGQKLSDGKYYGKNYLWLSINDPGTNKTILEGYLGSDNKIYGSIDKNPDIILLGDDFRYCFKEITFTDLSLTKFDIYSKWQDFSHEVIPNKPSDDSYKFKAAHITIRAVENQEILVAIKDQVLNNELIFVEDSKKLWIKSNNTLTTIAGAGNGDSGGGEGSDTNMTQAELIIALEKLGIRPILKKVEGKEDELVDLELSKVQVEDITFIHQSSGNKFKFYIDEKGELHSQYLGEDSTKFSEKLKNKTLARDVRGFIGTINSLTTDGISSRSDKIEILSDRLKIGSIYAPLSSDILHGCSHSYVELENSSDRDINLDNCYLHYTRPDDNNKQKVYSLKLTGVIPAGGTYLIRGKQHAELDDPNVYLKVATCDQEWYIEGDELNSPNKLISFEVNENQNILSVKDKGYGFVLTYGKNFGTDKYPQEITEKTRLVEKSGDSKSVGTSNNKLGATTFGSGGLSTKDFPYIFHQYFIDGIYYYKMVTDEGGVGYWAPKAFNITSNSIYRNTFELDPARQAFQSFCKIDSSRVRWDSGKDINIVSLDKEFIAFPHTEDIYPISNYTPKASFEHKNVCTDKTKLDINKPNMVSTSFGTNIYKTRCFNWISIGYYPEYVWIKKSTESSWGEGIQSYIPIQEIKIISTKENSVEGGTSTTIEFKVTTSGWSKGATLSRYTKLTDSNHKLLFEISSNFVGGETYTFTLSGNHSSDLPKERVYYLHQTIDDVFTDENISTYPKKKEFNADITNNIYARMTGRFPADNSFFTSHKVIVDVVDTEVSGKPVKYDYIVGRADKNGEPDPLHSSEKMSFTLYPTSYETQIYQITDQQGFHWVEYQVWAAAAKNLDDRINKDITSKNIIPILINTGDMTQNGTRINEWFDYYQAGRELFNHLEQMNVVGNNDLCGPNPFLLGTGDDSGKSNAYYFHVFYCYEVGGVLNNGNKFIPLIYPIENGRVNKDSAPKYVPSTYYFDSKNRRFLMVNSELTLKTCSEWFKCKDASGNPINLYTGYSIMGEDNVYNKLDGFTTIYTMLWRILDNSKTLGKYVVTACHEMPYTVITSDSLGKDYAIKSRSLSNSDKLVGSHLNQIDPIESGQKKSPKGLYWFSRLMEFYKVKLVIGGHKHTYACTYPVRENYKYEVDDGRIISSENTVMTMLETLEKDTANFIDSESKLPGIDIKDNSKFPLVKRDPSKVGSPSDGIFYPCKCISNLTGGVVYFMCQSTGYKYSSNKELPSPEQKFSRIIPLTTKDSKGKDSPDNNQKYPMFSIISMTGDTYSIKLSRVTHIFKSYKFDQKTFDKSVMTNEWISENDKNNYGEWGSVEKELIKVE